MNKKSKPKIAIVALTSCEGCQFAALDQGQKFLNLLAQAEVEEFRLIEDRPRTAGRYDIALVEGNPITKENLVFLKEIRKRSNWLVALGNCAALGGVWEIRNYQTGRKTAREIYRQKKAANPEVKEIDNFVKVDFTIPGCPIDGRELIECLSQLLAGKIPQIPQNPVCYECQRQGYPCLLQQGKICLGPITLAGCRAVCLKSGQPCWGCRGIFQGAQVGNFLNYLKKNFTGRQIAEVLEVFGVKDSVFEELKSRETIKKNQSRNNSLKF